MNLRFCSMLALLAAAPVFTPAFGWAADAAPPATAPTPPPTPPGAETVEAGREAHTLHILRNTVHAEQERPELCLDFDHALLADDQGHPSGKIKLESDGKTVADPVRNASVLERELCLPGLDHRKDYRLTIASLKAADGSMLGTGYSLSFDVPARAPALNIINSVTSGGMLRLAAGRDPVLRTQNIDQIRVELYRVTNPAHMADAFAQRQQTTLAPSESATFARSNGTLIWQGMMNFDGVPDQEREQTMSLKDRLATVPGGFAPGLYLLVANAPDANAASTAFAPAAAVWLLRSDLHLSAWRGDTNSFTILAAHNDANSVAPDIKLTAFDRDQKIVAEARSDAQGYATLTPADKRATPMIVMATDAGGQVDFFDLSQASTVPTVLDRRAEMTLAPVPVAPLGLIDIGLSIEDLHHHPLELQGSRIEIQYPDHTVFASMPVAPGANVQKGNAHLQMPAPSAGGSWLVVWKQNDGQTLAQNTVQVTTDPAAPRLEATADRAMLSGEGEINLTLKSMDADGHPRPYLTGQVVATWVAPDHIFAGSDDMKFGTGMVEAGEAQKLGSFITDDHGIARLPLQIALPKDKAPLHALKLGIIADRTSGAVVPDDLIIPVRPDDLVVGLRPRVAGGRFAENGAAQFDIVALDADGHRRAADNLSWRIFEQGRHFDWFQSEGRWEYKPLPQRRRVGSGNLSIAADGDRILKWPVTAGNYRLEILDAAGRVLSGMDFSAGWSDSVNATTMPEPLAIKGTPDGQKDWQAGQPIALQMVLDHPAMLNIVVADDKARLITQEARPAGMTHLSLPTSAAWGEHLMVQITADYGDGMVPARAQGLLELSGTTPREKIAAAKEDLPLNLQAILPDSLAFGDTLTGGWRLTNTTNTPASYRVTVKSTDQLKLAGAASQTVTLAAKQSKEIALNVLATAVGTANLRLEAVGSKGVRAADSSQIVVRQPPMMASVVDQQTLAPDHDWTLPVATDQSKNGAPLLFVGAEPLYELPVALVALRDRRPMETQGMAAQLAAFARWRDVMLAANVLPEPVMTARQDDVLVRLLARQNKDGGFASTPVNVSKTDGGRSEIGATASVVTALSILNQADAKPALDLASDWLKRQLENTWFEDDERPVRASAYAALAAAGKLDASALHYFSDTSAPKGLPPLAALQMAISFAAINDRDAAFYWLNAAHGTKGNPDLPPEQAWLIASNPFADAHDTLPALQNFMAKLAKDPAAVPTTDLAEATLALWHTQTRAGNWRASINHAESNPNHVIVLDHLDKMSGLHNLSGKALYATLAVMNAAPVTPNNTGAINRRITHLDGSDAGTNLQRGAFYLVTLQGPWGDDRQRAVHEDVAPALQALGCALDQPLNGDVVGALAGNASTAFSACEAAGSGFDLLLNRTGSAANWRVSYLVRAAYAGSFTLPIAVSAPFGLGIDNAPARAQQIQIKY